jgi:transposase-like protein
MFSLAVIVPPCHCKAVLERALADGLTGHLGYEKHDTGGEQQRELAERGDPEDAEGRVGEMELETPRDRISAGAGAVVHRAHGEAEPELLRVVAEG